MAGGKNGSGKRLPRNVRSDNRGGKQRFRALVRRFDKQFTGPLRDTPEQAAQDVPDTRAKAMAYGGGGAITFGASLNQVIELAQQRGLDERSVYGVWENPARRLRQFWDDKTPLASIDAEEVVWMIDAALAGRGKIARYKPVTIRDKWLPCLHGAFVAAGLPSPIAKAKQMRAVSLRVTPKVMPWFPPDELAALIQRMRAYRGPTPLRQQGRDVAIVTLLATTGLRYSELARANIQDLDEARATLVVAEAKDRTHPRIAQLPTIALEAAKTLAAGRAPLEPLVVGRERTINHCMEKWKVRLKEPRLNGRALRHSYLTGLRLTGASEFDVQDSAGHRRGSKETSRYIHEADQHVRRSSDRFADELERLLPGPSESPQTQPDPDESSER